MKVIKSIIDTIIISAVVLITFGSIVEQSSQEIEYRASTEIASLYKQA